MSALERAIKDVLTSKSKLFGEFSGLSLDDYELEGDELNTGMTRIRENTQDIYHLLIAPSPENYSMYIAQVSIILGHRATTQVSGKDLLDFLTIGRILYHTGTNEISFVYSDLKSY